MFLCTSINFNEDHLIVHKRVVNKTASGVQAPHKNHHHFMHVKQFTFHIKPRRQKREVFRGQKGFVTVFHCRTVGSKKFTVCPTIYLSVRRLRYTSALVAATQQMIDYQCTNNHVSEEVSGEHKLDRHINTDS